MGKFDSVLDEVYGKQNTKLTSVLDEIYGPEVEPVTMVENEPTPIADTLVGLNRGIESAGEAITSPIQKLFTAPPNQDVVVPEELDLGSMQAVRDRQAMLPPSMPAEPGYVPPAGITDALRVAPGLALDATGQMISGAIQQAQEVAPSMINRAYERFANADLGGVLPPQMQQKVAPIINIPQEDIDTIAAVGQQAEENIKARLQEARIQPGLNAPNIVANAASSIIQQAPLFAGTALGGPVVGAAGLAAMGIGSMGARYQKARASGYKPEEAMLESGLYGLAEIIPEKLGMDAIFAAAKNPYAAKSLVEGIKRLMVATGLSMTAEGLEETATQLAQNTIRKYVRPDSERITEKPVESIVEGVPEAAVTGAVAGGAIAGGLTGGGLGALQSMMTGQQQAEAPIEKPVDTQMTEFLKKQNDTRDNVRTTADVEKQMQEAEALRKISDEYNQLMRDEAKGKPTGEEIKRQRVEQMKSQAGFAEETQIDDTEAVIREAQKAATQAQQADARQRKANVLEGLFGQQEPQPMEGGRSLPYPKNDVIQEIRDAGLKTKNEVVAFFSGRHNITREGASNLLKIAYNQPLPERTYKTPPSKPPVQPPTIDQLFTRKPAVTFGEAERLRGEEVPTGGMTINRQARPTVTFGGEGERTGEAIPEGEGMTIQPTASSNKLDQLFRREPSRLDNYVKDFAPRDKTRIKNQLQTIDKIADEYGNIEILYDEKAKPQYKLSTKDGKEYRRINKTEYEYLKSIGKEAIEAKKPLQFEDLENMSDEEILAIPERELEKAARDNRVPFRDRVDFNIRLNKIKSSTPSPQPQQATEVAPKGITSQPAEPTAVKTPKTKITPLEEPKAQQGFGKGLYKVEAEGEVIHGVRDIDDLYYLFNNEKEGDLSTSTSERSNGINRNIIIKSKIPKTEGLYTPYDADAGKNFGYDELRINNKTFKDNIDKIIMDRQTYENLSSENPIGNETIAEAEARWRFYEDIAQQIEIKENPSENIFETPEIGDTIQWNTPKVLGKTQTKTGTIVDKTADNRWTVSIDGQEFDFNPQKNTNIKVVEKYQQPSKTEQEQYVETRRAEIAQEQKAKEEARQKEMQDLQSSIKTPEVKEPWQMTKEQYVNSRMADVKNKYPNATTKSLEMQKAKLESDYDAAIQNIPRDAEMLPEVLDSLSEKQRKQIFKFNENLEKEYFDKKNDASQMTYKQYLNWLDAKNYRWQKNKQAHKQIVKRAIEAGKSVPPEVLAEYPDLQPRPKSGPGMFGGATVQNMYEEIAPKVKKGADMLFKKGKQAYETVKRNADLTRDMGRVVDITEKDGRPVETEPPIRPRIGLFNLQNVYDALTRPMKRRAEDKRFKEHLDRTMAAGPRQRIEEARGIDKLSFMDKARKAITRAKELATRKFPDLDEKQFPEFANKLRVLDGGKDYADGTAGYIVGETIKDLSPEEYNVFGTSLILDDLQKGLDTGLYTNDLPFGYDAQSLAADRQAIDPTELRKAGFNDKADRIEEAIRKRNDFMREVKQEAVDNGLLPEAVMNDDRYFHHQVLQYMNMQDESKSGVKKDVRLGKKSYRMSRTGSLLDFNSEYAQAEFEVLSQMIEDNKRAEFLKYVESLDITPNLRAEAQAQGLPTDAKTLKELIPPTYVEWQPAKGNNFYKVFTIPERIVEEIIAKGDAVDVSMDDINEALAVGGPKKTLVIPEGLVKTLDNFKAPRNDGALGKIGNFMNKVFKTSMLFMPSRVSNYMLTNAFGDTDVVLAYNYKILGWLPEAMKELKANDRKNNKDLENAYKQQVIGANITEKEIQNIDYESINKPFNIMRYLKNPLNIGKDYLQKAVRINAFRENALRYAAYKYFLSELRAGKKNIYAASDRTKIDGITDMEEKAATLARDLMGDYGNVSALGEEIARKIIPFYRWMEVNTPRYYRLLKNASNEGGYEGAIKGGYKRLKRFVQMNIVGTILYQLYHAAIGAVSGDDELEKARDVTRARGQLHSLLPNWLIGDDKKDIVRTVRTQGAWSDVTETLIGTSDLFSDVMDVATGKTKFKDKMKELGWKLDNPADFFNIPPIRKYSMAALPLARTAAEVLTGRASTRSLMETRPIRDRMQHFAKAMALGAPYNIATDKPGPERGATDLVTYKTNLGEVAYNEITRKKYEFLRERGYPLPSASESPSGTAYYNLKQAVKFGDKKQIRKYFKEYNQERRKLGKDAADWYDVKERIKESADPSSFMKEELWDEFRKTLNNEEKRKLKTAMRWFKETYK